MSTRSVYNLFYPLLVIVGIAFCITALAYVASWVRMQPPSGPVPELAEMSPASRYLYERGEWLLLWEAIALGVLAVLAMGFDQWRNRRDASKAAE
jgi:uncharacterized membrane protein